MPRSQLPAILRSRIDTLGLDASRVAAKAGINKSTLSKLLDNPEIIPELKTLEKLSRALEIPLIRLLVAVGYDPGDHVASTEIEQTTMLLEAVPELQEVAQSMAAFSPDERRAILAYIEIVQSRQQ